MKAAAAAAAAAPAAAAVQQCSLRVRIHLEKVRDGCTSLGNSGHGETREAPSAYRVRSNFAIQMCCDLPYRLNDRFSAAVCWRG